MKKAAILHTKEMQIKYPSQIAESATRTRIYKDTDANCQSFRLLSAPPIIGVLNRDSIYAALCEANGVAYSLKPCILNFASYSYPGGGLTSITQEEELCYHSYLYNVLEQFDKKFYLPHRLEKNKFNKGLYQNEALFTPDVIFTKNDINFKADVLTCAAPNYVTASRDYKVTPEENSLALESRIKFIWQIMEMENVQIAILGAFGCGIFGQNAIEVATIMNKTFKLSSIPTIVYAVPKEKNEYNYQAFKDNIAETVL